MVVWGSVAPETREGERDALRIHRKKGFRAYHSKLSQHVRLLSASQLRRSLLPSSATARASSGWHTNSHALKRYRKHEPERERHDGGRLRHWLGGGEIFRWPSRFLTVRLHITGFLSFSLVSRLVRTECRRVGDEGNRLGGGWCEVGGGRYFWDFRVCIRVWWRRVQEEEKLPFFFLLSHNASFRIYSILLL